LKGIRAIDDGQKQRAAASGGDAHSRTRRSETREATGEFKEW
jgi:hypothetical protein